MFCGRTFIEYQANLRHDRRSSASGKRLGYYTSGLTQVFNRVPMDAEEPLGSEDTM